MAGDGHDVALQSVDIGEDVVVDALKHVVGAIVFGSAEEIGVIDQSVAERLYCRWGAVEGKPRCYVEELFHWYIVK